MKTIKGKEVLRYLIRNIENFGEAKYTKTNELNCVGRLSYNCVNMAAAMNAIKMMEESNLVDVKSMFPKSKEIDKVKQDYIDKKLITDYNTGSEGVGNHFQDGVYWALNYLKNKSQMVPDHINLDNLDKRIKPEPISTTEVKVKVVGVLKIGESNLICPQCNRGFTEPETYGSVFCCKACEFGF